MGMRRDSQKIQFQPPQTKTDTKLRMRSTEVEFGKARESDGSKENQEKNLAMFFLS
jgi:hypothetical protein